ncbi:nitrate reductase subunit alpha [Nonomuraea terrae]|uniref:nitrate reductase (quinone) n=1 Tax=Nonomuraea terrae TaxID=2530383 RepID=A0A4R4YNX8_9ACTN|nr:nitrate reductase subunit alpha [Nonomuraea terrae]TDD46825.1 nitrate reductase subunit alpha [Nonomuraea terrae]
MNAEDLLLKTGRFLRRSATGGDLHTLHLKGGTEGDAFYRDRWSHDKVVRSTHGVNCTGSCSWNVYVKDGIITWETQETDYPSVGPDRPEYEPRGCPRGAAFSWYTYSPTRIRYPYARGVLVEMYAEARRRLGDPVAAWAEITTNPEKREKYQSARGKGGLVRITWALATEMIAAAHVHTIQAYGPDRIAGFSPIPAMSMVSQAIGARFVSLIGGAMLSFYDWYADLPVASPQVFGDQTDVPESADWWDAAYLFMWGSNVPVTRTPDAHWMAEARYRGQKVVVVAPDFSDAAKFADEFLSVRPGTDGALAMAMGHVLLKEFFVDRETPYFAGYVRRFTDLPFLVTLDEHDDAYVPGRFLTAKDLGSREDAAEWKTVLMAESGEPVVPNGSAGFRWTESGAGHWNLNLDVTPKLTLLGDETAEVLLPRFDGGHSVRRGVPVRRVGGRLVTTAFDLLLAQYGVRRPGLPGVWPGGYGDAGEPYTPAWQEPITGVPAARAVKIVREFARTAEETEGRCMIILGAGAAQWFHGDTMYRAFLTLLLLTGCQGRNGGGWAHYVGQEKCRTLAGWQLLAGALDWSRPPRQVPGTPFWYLHTGQWRYDHYDAGELASPLAKGVFSGRRTADLVAQSVREGWMPMAPAFDRNPLDLGEADDPIAYTYDELAAGRLRFAADDPDDPRNWPRVLTLWRSNLLGSSAKGNEYFLRHLLGATSNLEHPDPRAASGKLDLLLTLDFRMTSSTVFSDIVLPAATWYEKHDLSSTDMHPFVHAFNPAINPPWETKTDFAAFHAIARAFSALARGRLGVRKDVVALAYQHDTPGEIAGRPGRPELKVVERDYGAVAEKLAALGPLTEELGIPVKGVTFLPDEEVEWLAQRCGLVPRGVAKGRPELDTEAKACETILALSGVSNGRLAAQGFRQLAERTGVSFDGLTSEHHRIVFSDTQARPMHVAASPEWSGKESQDRRYAPFTINVEHGKPWHTLTGRMHFFLDHEWMHEYGEALPVYRPPLDLAALHGEKGTLRFLTPHSKWSIHSEYQDNLLLLTLSRGGPTIWMSTEDAAALGIADNDWVEAVNRNGVVVARAIVSHRMPAGTVYMYHAQDRLIDVPKSEATGRRGGIHNALTRVLVKPTHLIGGHAQLSYGFNYLGPTGNQRDEITTIRRRSQEVTY